MISNLERAILITTLINVTLSRLSHYFKQYTMWNMIFLLYSFIIDSSDEIIVFLTINTINICIIFHCFFILEPNLIRTIPKAMNLSIKTCFIKDIVLHIIPIFPISKIYFSKIFRHPANISLYLILYTVLWALIITSHDIKIGDIYTFPDKHYKPIALLTVFFYFLTPQLLWHIKLKYI